MIRAAFAALALLALPSVASATEIVALSNGQSANIPSVSADENAAKSAGPKFFGPGLVPSIRFDATQPDALFGYTGQYWPIEAPKWEAGGPPIIANNIDGASSFTLTFLQPIAAFLAEMTWSLRAEQVVSFSTLDKMGNVTETVVLRDGVTLANLRQPGGSYGIGRAAADIYGIVFSNRSLAIRNLQIASSYTADPTSPVPEPSAWLLMLTGFFCVGGAVRRRSPGLRLTAA